VLAPHGTSCAQAGAHSRSPVSHHGEEEFEDDVTNTGHERVDEAVHLGSDIEAADEASDLHTDREREVGAADDDVSEVSVRPHPVPAQQPSLEEPPASKPPSVHDVKISYHPGANCREG